jgi:myosin-5
MSSINSKTVGSQFKFQLTELMSTIRATNPHYVRTIKPNDGNKPALFNRHRVLVLTVLTILTSAAPAGPSPPPGASSVSRWLTLALGWATRSSCSTRVVEQLRCGGLLEAVRVARAGYPTRMPHAQFIVRYRMLESNPAKNERLAKVVKSGKADEINSCAKALLVSLRCSQTRLAFHPTRLSFEVSASHRVYNLG